MLDGEGDDWLTAARAEGRVCRQAVRLLETVRGVGASADDRADPAARHRALAEGAVALAMGAQAVRRSTHTTFGSRNSLRPVLSQHDDGEWRFHAASVEVSSRATDALVAYALAVVDAEA